MNKIKNIILDFDGVFYPYSGLGENDIVFEYFDNAYANAANLIFPDNGMSVFPNYIDIGYEKFIAQIRTLGNIDTGAYPLESIAQMHVRFHENMLAALGPENQDILFSSVATVKQDLHALKEKGVNLAILSHSDKEAWLDHILTPREMHHLFHPVIDYKTIGFNSKSASGYALEYTMNLMGADPKETLFVEDSPSNIKMAYNTYPGLRNFLISSKIIAEAHYHAPTLASAMPQIMKLV